MEKSVVKFEYSEKILELPNAEIEVEYQGETIGKFGLDFNGKNFLLTTKQTDCLARDKCDIPAEKPKVNLYQMTAKPCCAPEGNCC